MTIKTDGDVMKACGKIEQMQNEITDLINAIRDGEHPNAAAIAEALYEQCWFPAGALIEAHEHLSKPDDWHVSSWGVIAYNKTAKKAADTRRANKIRAR